MIPGSVEVTDGNCFIPLSYFSCIFFVCVKRTSERDGERRLPRGRELKRGEEKTRTWRRDSERKIEPDVELREYLRREPGKEMKREIIPWRSEERLEMGAR